MSYFPFFSFFKCENNLKVDLYQIICLFQFVIIYHYPSILSLSEGIDVGADVLIITFSFNKVIEGTDVGADDCVVIFVIKEMILYYYYNIVITFLHK